VTLTAALPSAVSGPNIAQRALSVTADNVANANTDVYSRKVVSRQALVVGNRGTGVEVTETARLTDNS
jgi:flagellar hook-associated protein 1